MMQGVSVDDAGFCVDPVSTAERFESFSLALQSQNASAFAPSPKTSGDLRNISEAGSSLDICWSPSQTDSILYNCSSSLGGASTSHSSSAPHSRPFLLRDLNAQNAADCEIAGGSMLPSFHDFVANSDVTELGGAGDAAGFVGSNSGIMMGAFFCDLRNMSGGAPFRMDGSCGSPGVLVGSPSSSEALSVFESFLSSTTEDSSSLEDLYSSDEFRMFEFKVRRCMRGRSHDWTECPFAHPGEKARRRDPRRFHYSGAGCPDFRKGNCKRGEACEFAHGVFETWLHPARYRTQPCKDGRNCTRNTCFFAHTPEQLRLLPAAAQAASAAMRSGESCQTQLNAIKACAAQNVSCCGSFDGSSSMQSAFGDTFDGSMSYDRFGCLAHGLFDGSCSRHGGCHGGSPRFKVGAQLSSFNCASHGGICCVSPQISSPTSTLVGLSPSPPTLSPPLSPTEGPPHYVDWKANFSHPFAVTSPRGAFSYNLPSPSQTSISQVQNLVSQTQSNSSLATAAGTNIPHTSAHVMASVQRQHMDRLNSIPTLAIPNVERRLLQSFVSAPSSPHNAVPTSSKAMSDLVTTLQQLELKGANPIWKQTQAAQAPQTSSLYSSGPSPLRRSSYINPSTRPGDDVMIGLWEAVAIEEDGLGWVNKLVEE